MADKQTPRALFVERMKREGREKEWFETVKRLQEETKKGFSPAANEAMRLMGYESPDKERELHAQHLSTLHRSAADVQRGKEQDEMWRDQEAYDFDAAVRSLPDKAAVQDEIDWIRAHPAMTKKDRSKDALKIIEVDVNDIMCPPHGKAPSKSAVIALQHWVNHPIEFFKSVLSEHKKATESDGGRGSALKDVGLEEVEDMLENFGNEIDGKEGGKRRSEPTLPQASGGNVAPISSEPQPALAAVVVAEHRAVTKP
jgi:hypothetical protein